MGALSDQILSALGLRKQHAAPVFDEQAVLMSKLASELCAGVAPGYLCGPSGSGKTSAIEPLARALLARGGHSVLAIVLSEEALPGFEDNPWCVRLDDGTEMDLVQFMAERPACFGRLELPVPALMSHPRRRQVTEGLERVLHAQLRLSDSAPVSNALTLFVDEPGMVLGEADLVRLTEQATNAAARFIWLVQAPPQAELQALCHHAMFLLSPNPAHLGSVPPGARLALAEHPLLRGQLGYFRMSAARAGQTSMLRVRVPPPVRRSPSTT